MFQNLFLLDLFLLFFTEIMNSITPAKNVSNVIPSIIATIANMVTPINKISTSFYVGFDGDVPLKN